MLASLTSGAITGTITPVDAATARTASLAPSRGLSVGSKTRDRRPALSALSLICPKSPTLNVGRTIIKRAGVRRKVRRDALTKRSFLQQRDEFIRVSVV